ncbi:aryl-alcohol dehydrogenase [Pueribacillus theae]|uniref:Aryl-alcohol dehydrogenase n=1 Tax=Pueribacillus theae TaxID=2171751 RepID=A0A2U1JJE5_9BACI|nr:NAD(P)-dependent alcohol dehydrogenase [Pueribacillus theae]PWA05119.1 aryl-alcohol dehydrogenase [Pueribacillus theae]
MTKAAITYRKGEQFKIENIEIDHPKSGEILVKIVATGMCHTDLLARDQISYVPLPAVLGHEGAGIVEEIGEGVTTVEPGDHVILTFDSCGKCDNCYNGHSYACDEFFSLNFQASEKAEKQHRLHSGGVHLTTFFGQSSFAQYSMATERNVIKVEKDVPLEILGPLACGVQTGAGTVLNKLNPKVGSSIAIFGCGAVGLSAVMAAKIAGCNPIIAVDIHDERLKLATELGATHTINSKQQNAVESILEITGKGVNYAVESSGLAAVIRESVESLASLGISAIIGSSNDDVNLNIRTLRNERTVTGVLEGSSVPQVFIPQMIELYKAGKFPFDKLIKFYSLEDINQASCDMESGVTIKPVIKMNEG